MSGLLMAGGGYSNANSKVHPVSLSQIGPRTQFLSESFSADELQVRGTEFASGLTIYRTWTSGTLCNFSEHFYYSVLVK